MDAVADVDFNTNPADPEFTTYDEHSEERVEKLNKLSRDEQYIILRYRLITTEQKKAFALLLSDTVKANENAKKEAKRIANPHVRKSDDELEGLKWSIDLLSDSAVDIRRKRRKVYKDD